MRPDLLTRRRPTTLSTSASAPRPAAAATNSGGSEGALPPAGADRAGPVNRNEGEVDDDVHDDHFPRAGAPSSVSATRPSSWDEDDIRSTWIQNVSEGN